MKVFLSGPMGSGKSTVGPQVAERLAVAFVDVDAEIEARAGVSIAAIFAHRGEAAFRAIEAAVIAELAGRDGVFALGGGAVAHDATRRRLLELGTLVTLSAPIDVLASRIAGGDRPNERRLAALIAERASSYAEAHAIVETGDRSPRDVAAEIASLALDPPVLVALGSRSYRVEIARGIRSRARGSLIVTDGNVRARWAAPIAAASNAPIVELPPGEQHKHVGSVEAIWDAAIAHGLDREAMIVAVGGGVVGDIAGFAAASYLRGVRFAQVPTTLLAMVDSSVGGKTGVDRGDGKNLVGAFHQPSYVLCDVETLETLPPADRIAGLAEVAKSAWLAGEAAVAGLEQDAARLREGELDATIRAIRMAVALKARIVASDEREAGARMWLNLGHTIGHAIESASGFSMRHGEAVALGLCAAFRVARRTGRASGHDAARMEALLVALGLPVELDRHLGEATFALVGKDKKRSGTSVRFVVPGPPGEPAVERIAIDALPGLIR